jgi:hypothetical protein
MFAAAANNGLILTNRILILQAIICSSLYFSGDSKKHGMI